MLDKVDSNLKFSLLNLSRIYFSVIEQVQNKKLTTFSLDYLNKIFLETEAEVNKQFSKQNSKHIYLYLAI